MVTLSGNKPPTSFEIANVETMRDYVFHMKSYLIALPSAKSSDFVGKSHYGHRKAWKGFTHYNKDITLYLDAYYHITVGTSGKIRKYGKRESYI